MNQLMVLLRQDHQINNIVLSSKDQDIEIHHDPKKITIQQYDTILTHNDFYNAKIIFFFRWKMKRSPFIISTLKNNFDKNFSEREWDSLFLGMLMYCEEIYTNALWINKPSLYNNQFNKYWLICLANSIGFKVPTFFTSNRFKLIQNSDFSMVTKSISSDENIDENRYFYTTRLSKEFIRASLNKKSVCPTFLQMHLNAKREIRVYYLLGDILPISIRSEKNYDDIRTLEEKEIEFDRIGINSEYYELIRAYCDRVGFNYCCFDFIDIGNDLYLIDITPNGSWNYIETICDIDISQWMKEVIEKILNLNN